ncbi:CAP domain-containing protein [Nocardiopsis sp. FIRDI 009]|uniref:CAP domain-containing protein n=1 Tax=Nocardiopsis sp. FIRDI 009 TaxID=714197 RepID=UPI001E51D5A0|nr:CAP domain-containing protein [Nocardiopsis sp. FIRDI 009]
MASLTAVPVGLALAGVLLVTDLGDRLDPSESADASHSPAGRIGSAVADDSAVPDAATDDDFFEAPTTTPEGTERTGSGQTATARATAPAATGGSDDGADADAQGGSGDEARQEGAGGDGGAAEGSGAPPAPLSDSATEQVVRLVNAERTDAGCGPLRVDDRLTAAAQEHSEDMDARNYVAHVNPDKETPADRAARHGYRSYGAENVAKGQTSAEQVMDDWMNSPGHRRNILNCGLVAIGVGEANHAWTQVFGWE